MNNNLATVFEKVQEIAQLALSGNYLFRGEPEHFPRVCSSLFREFESTLGESDDHVTFLERQIVSEARSYTALAEENDILTELQHFGHFTNLIDFTSDYNIALFFACDGSVGKSGRVILLEPSSDFELIVPSNPVNRVLAQKSVFVRSPHGFVVPTHVVDIPSGLKAEIISYLRIAHGITTSTIYNDLHGFIRQQAIHQNAIISLFTGYQHYMEDRLDEALESFGQTIQLRPNQAEAYLLRGHIYSIKAFRLLQEVPVENEGSDGKDAAGPPVEDQSAALDAYIEAGKADLSLAWDLNSSDTGVIAEQIQEGLELLKLLQME